MVELGFGFSYVGFGFRFNYYCLSEVVLVMENEIGVRLGGIL